MPIDELPFEDFPFIDDLVGINMFGTYFPPVVMRSDGGYTVCVSGESHREGNVLHMHWEYFTFDATGLVVQSPPGMGEMFDFQMRFRGLKEAVAKYAKEGK